MGFYGILWWFNGILWDFMGSIGIYPLVMTNIAMENPNHKWSFLAGKILYFSGPFSMAMLNNQRVYIVSTRCQLI